MGSREPRRTSVLWLLAGGPAQESVLRIVTSYYEWGEGEWHEPVHDGYLMACCDCGLIHRVDFAIRDGKQVQMRVFRDDRRTRKERTKPQATKPYPGTVRNAEDSWPLPIERLAGWLSDVVQRRRAKR